MSFTDESYEDKLRREEKDYIAKAEKKTHDLKLLDTPEIADKRKAAAIWKISLRDIPTGPEQASSLVFRDVVIWKSAADGSDASAEITQESTGWSTRDKFTLKIPCMEFEASKDYSLNDGVYLLFAAGESGMQIKQQTAPFK
eukprot:TRINITY_DN2134_c0_g1_i1.p1 TRINITY_DN2134_c0_g1~~TRINITY_DN2134_c0_g1_i1.p1  ORF type:complete len:149 (-),score=23.71 TRINITY_DN2134_c0_g1_i1:50-475(-)